MNISEILRDYGPLVAIIYLVFKDIRSGGKAVSTEVMANYKALDDQQKTIIAEKDAAIIEIKGALKKAQDNCLAETSNLRGQVEEKDKTILAQKIDLAKKDETIANRNPDLEKILVKLAETNEQILVFMTRLTQTNLHQTQMIEGQMKRESSQDTASDSQQGNVLRKPFNP